MNYYLVCPSHQGMFVAPWFMCLVPLGPSQPILLQCPGQALMGAQPYTLIFHYTMHLPSVLGAYSVCKNLNR